MSSELAQIRVKDLGRIVTGKTPSTANNEFFGGDIPFLTPTDMVEGKKVVKAARTLTTAGLATVKNCLVPKGVAVSCIGWQMGKSVLVMQPTVTNQQINTVIVDESRFDFSFVYYLLSSMREQIFELGATPTRTPIVNKSTFGDISILVPGLKEQQRIAALCSSIDDRITLQRETNITLEAIAQALFKSWFVDFDPVRAKMEGREPDGMDAETAGLFPDSFEESELGLVPKGWRVGVIENVAEKIFSGGTPDTRRPDFWVGTLRWFSSGETRNNIIIDTEKRINKDAVEGSSTKLVLPGDVLIASAGQGHTRGQTSYCAVETYINQSVVSVRASHSNCSPEWMYFNLSRRYEEMRNLSDSHSSRGSLTTKLLAGMPVLIPNFGLIQAFSNIASICLKSVADNERQSQILSQLRDTLLPRLISGQLRLPEVEEQIMEAACA